MIYMLPKRKTSNRKIRKVRQLVSGKDRTNRKEDLDFLLEARHDLEKEYYHCTT